MAELWNFESLIDRSNYNLNDHGRPGQRDISESQIKKITDGIRTSERPYIGTLVVGMEYDIEFVKIEKGVEVMPGVFLVKIMIYEGAPIIWSVDGQYRVMAVTRCWSSVKDAVENDALSARRVIEESAVELTLLLEGDHDILADLFHHDGVHQADLSLADRRDGQELHAEPPRPTRHPPGHAVRGPGHLPCQRRTQGAGQRDRRCLRGPLPGCGGPFGCLGRRGRRRP
ncbi:hypothetical protein OG709_27895 [Streptomyces sp. NBC_01267]|uniref:hypothetical protein n=1 Tax=Streptomyces sp. NBC_01267 TaxID=2903805 RepID=UPI003FCCD8DB